MGNMGRLWDVSRTSKPHPTPMSVCTNLSVVPWKNAKNGHESVESDGRVDSHSPRGICAYVILRIKSLETRDREDYFLNSCHGDGEGGGQYARPLFLFFRFSIVGMGGMSCHEEREKVLSISCGVSEFGVDFSPSFF